MKTKAAASPVALAALRRTLKASKRKGLSRYAQLRDALVAGIEAGHWKPGERLPTESELSRATPFSLGTIQRALRALVDEGVVTRVQGSGSFVSSVHSKIEDVAHCRFLGDDGQSFLPVFSRVVSRRPAPRAGPWSVHFPGRGTALVRVDRVLNVNGEFNVYSRFYFDGGRFKGLASRPFSQLAGANFKELLREEFSVPMTKLDQRILLARIPSDVCRRIGLSKGATGAVLEVVARTRGNATFYYQQIFIPPSPRKLVPYSVTA